MRYFEFTLRNTWSEEIINGGKRTRQDCFAGPATARAQVQAINKLILSAEIVEETEETTKYKMEV